MENRFAPFPARRGGTTRSATARLALVVALLVLAGVVSLQVVQGMLRERAAREASSILSGAEVAVEGWLDRYRSLPSLYATSPWIVAALQDGVGPEELNEIDRELADWNRIANTSDTYVMAPDGTTIAASNWDQDISFVGQNFAYRPYFTDAMDGRTGRFFGLGTTSGLRGYYFSAPVRDEGRILGVVVVKISALEFEAALSDAAHPLFVTDDAGIVALAGLPSLRLTALDPVDDAMRDLIEETRRYDLSDLAPAPIAAAGAWASDLPLVTGPAHGGNRGTRRYLHLNRGVEGGDWTLHLLYDTSAVRIQMQTAAAAVIAAGVAIAALAALALQRRHRLMQRLADRERDQVELERKVAMRTGELIATNARLEREVGERRAAVASMKQTQSELVQAGKLAALGQMSAALSHEFNQPLAAIRTYAENATAFHEAGRSDRAQDNLGRIIRLTERMAQLSKHLTRFARRSGDDVVPVPLDEVVSEALELLAGRIERAGATVRLEGETGLTVMGGTVRLQHVLLNLVGNAIEAVPESRPPEVTIGLHRRGDHAEVTVTDNGSGIADEVLPMVFDPFFSTKEVGKGLGLGLSISYNIVKDFGGTMRARSDPDGGARFTVTLPLAGAGLMVAAQ